MADKSTEDQIIPVRIPQPFAGQLAKAAQEDGDNKSSIIRRATITWLKTRARRKVG